MRAIVFKRKPKSAKPKKEKKARKSKRKVARSSALDSASLVKQPTDIYMIMLIIALVAVLIGCILLWVELSSYEGYSYPWRRVP
jgi:hypothetical protein